MADERAISTPGYDFGDAPRRSLDVSEPLCEEGAADTDVFLVESGAFAVERATAVGTMVVATVGPGQVLGEGTNTMGGVRSATVRATEPSVVSVLAQPEYFAWLDAHPQHAASLAAQARHRLNRTRAAGLLARLFGLDNQAVVDAVVDEVEWVTLRPGEILFEQGDNADAAYFVIAGRLHIHATDQEDTTTLDLELGRGEIVGEMGIIDTSLRSADVRAIRETTLARISRTSFESLSAAHVSLTLQVFHTIIDRLMRRTSPDERARVVGFAITAPDLPTSTIASFVAAVEPFGSTVHLHRDNLGLFVHQPDGPGGTGRVAEFLHEADVAHDYVLLQGEAELTSWASSVARQSDRYVLFTSADPAPAERQRIAAHLAELTAAQRATAWVARVHQPGEQPARGTAVLTELGVKEVHNLRVDEPGHFARLGRLATGNGTGLVLGGGGAKGLAHIGAIRALQEAGIECDRIGGTSMGSVIAGFVGQDRTTDEMLAASIEDIAGDMFDFTVPVVSLVKGDKLTKTIANQFSGWDISDLWIPYFAVSTNLTTARLHVHRCGDLVTAIRASSALPVILPPVPIDGELHVDGGVLDNVPISPMASDPTIGRVIAVDVSPPGGPAAEKDYGLSVSGFEALRNKVSKKRTTAHPDIAQTLMSSMLIGSSKAKLDSIDMADLYLDLDLSGVGLLTFENHAEVAERGYAEAERQILSWLD